MQSTVFLSTKIDKFSNVCMDHEPSTKTIDVFVPSATGTPTRMNSMDTDAPSLTSYDLQMRLVLFGFMPSQNMKSLPKMSPFPSYKNKISKKVGNEKYKSVDLT